MMCLGALKSKTNETITDFFSKLVLNIEYNLYFINNIKYCLVYFEQVLIMSVLFYYLLKK